MNIYIDLINKHLKKYLQTIENQQLQELMEYSLFPGGKRFRPLLLLTLIDDCQLSLDLGINAACGVEMIHNYSLIHDDLPSMDNDDYRRGKLSVHKQFGEALAILAGDALLTDSFKFFCKGDLDNDTKIKLVTLAAKNAGSNGMVYGQVLDMNPRDNYSLEDVKKIHLHKTKDLISLSIMAGGLIANFDDNKLSVLEEISYYFGLAFQIKDDIDDYQEKSSDLINQKATYPAVVGLKESKRILIDYKNIILNLTKNILGENKFYELVTRVL